MTFFPKLGSSLWFQLKFIVNHDDRFCLHYSDCWLDVMLWWMIGCACVTIRDTVTVSVTGAVCDVWQDWDQSQLYNFSWSSVPTLGPRCSTSPSHLKISLSRWTGRALSALSGQTSLITPHTNTQILTRTCSNFGYYWENYNWFPKVST